jgi:hypothetical protein
LTCALTVGSSAVCLAEQVLSVDSLTSVADPHNINFGDRFKETSTVEKLQYIKSDPDAGDLASFVAKEILKCWLPDEINRTGQIGFWWDTSPNTNAVVHLHAFCRAIYPPADGTWPISFTTSSRGFSKREAVDAFVRAGFKLTHTNPDDNALQFIDRRLSDQ